MGGGSPLTGVDDGDRGIQDTFYPLLQLSYTALAILSNIVKEVGTARLELPSVSVINLRPIACEMQEIDSRGIRS